MRTTLILVLALAVAPLAAWAQSEEALVERYAVLAGSDTNAKALVSGLRTGSDIKIVYGGVPLEIDPLTGKMGNGSVNITLALTEASLKDIAKPTARQFEAALTGVLQRRANGAGWGNIAQELGFKLGDVMRSERAQPHLRAAHADQRPDRAERHSRPERPERHGRPERPERVK
jgi:hypothetical protein